jgi:hypothetical protein
MLASEQVHSVFKPEEAHRLEFQVSMLAEGGGAVGIGGGGDYGGLRTKMNLISKFVNIASEAKTEKERAKNVEETFSVLYTKYEVQWQPPKYAANCSHCFILAFIAFKRKILDFLYAPSRQS